MVNTRVPPIGRPEREAVDLVQTRRVDPDDHPDDRLRAGWRLGVAHAAPAEQERRRAGHRDDDDEGEREQVAGAPVHRSGVQDAAAPVPMVPVPVLPGAYSGVPSAQRGQVAGPGS